MMLRTSGTALDGRIQKASRGCLHAGDVTGGRKLSTKQAGDAVLARLG
jgi:hypothetical protein